MKVTLQSCPFCDGRELGIYRNEELGGIVFISCENCRVVVSFMVEDQSPTNIARLWNRGGERYVEH